MTQQLIRSDEAPKPIGPYSQAVQLGQLVFVSGTLGVDPATGQLVGEGVEEQTRQVFANMGKVLAAAGTSLNAVVKTTVFLADLADFGAMNGVYAEYLHEKPPARSTFQVAKLPAGARVEIEAIAFVA